MAEQRVVIVGAGHAGFQLAASLRQGGFDGAIVLLGDEPALPYQRPPLSKDYLDGKIGLDLLLMRPEAFYREHRIDYLSGTKVDAIDRAQKTVHLASGERLNYGHLVLATGARNRVPPIPAGSTMSSWRAARSSPPISSSSASASCRMASWRRKRGSRWRTASSSTRNS